MKKLRILAVMNDSTSVGHFRSGWPGAYIRDNFKDEIEIIVLPIESIMVWDMKMLSLFDVIHFNRFFGYIESVNELFPLIQSHGIKLVMDIDDHWELPDEFPSKKDMLKELGGSMEGILNIIRKADHVTTTTELFKKELLKLNENVSVLPNAIDMSHKMWQFEEKPREKVNIAWLGSSQRYHDLLRLKDSIAKLYVDQELKGKFTITQYGGDKIDNEIFEGEGFIHLPQLPPFLYGSYYSGADICLAPLKDNIYNQCKSEIKMVEAGMNNKVFVCQDYGIYSEHIIHGVNGFLIENDDKWYDILKSLILDKETRNKVSGNLNDYVKVKFSLDSIARKRIQFYKSLCNGEN